MTVSEAQQGQTPQPWPAISQPRWRLFLDVLFALAVVVGVMGSAFGLVMVLQDQEVGHRRALYATLSAIALIVHLVAVGVWMGGLRHRGHPRLAWALAAVAVVVALTAMGASAILFILFAVTVCTIELGAVRSGGIIAAVMVAIVAGAVIFGDYPNALSALLDSIFVGLVLCFGLVLGSLLRDLERTRGAAIAANAELTVTNARLREAMVAEGDLVLAEERARSSAELHDGLGHRLTVTSMSLEFALRMRDRDPARAWAEVANAADGNRAALAHMRMWVRALSPAPVRPGEGGATAFEAIADSFRGTGLDVRVDHLGDEAALPDRVTLLAYRLVQEGLTNVLRYAGATAVVIEVTQDAQRVRVAVHDNGEATQPPVEGFGLRSLRERAEDLGGALSAGPHPEGGFELAVTVPIGAGSVVARDAVTTVPPQRQNGAPA